MKHLIKTYYNILNEDKNYFGFQINEHIFPPFEYNRTFVAAASTCETDINHVLTRLHGRTNAALNDVFIILKRGIDKFLQLQKTKYKNTRVKSFHIISKSYPDFKLVVLMVRNDQKDIFRYLENNKEFFFNCNYCCFLHTILKTHMLKRPIDDELFVEEIQGEKQKIDILYVE
jgi:hypothetical protein